VAAVARSVGLQVFDLQAGHLYRLDGTRVDAAGETLTLPKEPPARALRARAPRPPALEEGPIRERMEAVLAARLCADGFVLERDGRLSTLRRVVGDIEQRCVFNTYQDGRKVGVHVRYAFVVPVLRSHWHGVLRAQAQRYGTRRSLRPGSTTSCSLRTRRCRPDA
jgi:hypothetical protein